MPNKGRKSTDFVRHFSILITFLPNAALRISCSINTRKIQPAVTGKLARNARTPGQTKTTPFYLILSTPAVKSNARGPQSRQKTGFSAGFCLPPHQNPPRAPPKVEQNLQNLKKCSTTDSKSAPRGLLSRTKSPKFEKMFYRRLKIRPARAPK